MLLNAREAQPSACSLDLMRPRNDAPVLLEAQRQPSSVVGAGTPGMAAGSPSTLKRQGIGVRRAQRSPG
jgi:hypothetical protein